MKCLFFNIFTQDNLDNLCVAPILCLLNSYLLVALIMLVSALLFLLFFLNNFQFTAWEVVGEDLLVGITLGSHHSGTDLAQTYAVSPT